MKLPKIAIVAGTAVTLGLLAACASTGPTERPGAPASASAPSPSATPPSAAPSPSATASSTETGPGAADDGVLGTVVRFTSDGALVDVTINQDTPAVRDFLSMLPLTLDVEELSGREKIAYLPRELNVEGTPGSDPEDGDLIYYTPWGNLGFYYDASGIEYSDQTLHLGTYDATLDQLNLLEGADVTIEIAR